VSDDLNYRVPDAILKAATRLDEAFATDEVACVYIEKLAEFLLSIAEEFGPPYGPQK
jgi:hypothetical protein